MRVSIIDPILGITFMQGMVGNQVNITIDVELVNGNVQPWTRPDCSSKEQASWALSTELPGPSRGCNR